MNQPDPLLLSSWLAHQYVEEHSAEYEKLFWTFEAVKELYWTSPDEAWAFVIAAWATDRSSVIAEILSAGPLEDLLAMHGDVVIDRVEAKAKEDPTFAFLLGGVWRNAINEAVWSRVLAIRDRRGWDGIPAVTNDDK